MIKNEPIKDQKTKKQKLRSPNYPSITLQRALELTKTIYETDGMQKIPVAIAYGRWGYKAGSSSGDLALAALRAYGLIEIEGTGDKRQIGLTEVSRKIFLDHPDKKLILQEAALQPTIHKEVWDYYKGNIPKDDVFKHYLIWDKKFNEKSIASFISQFRETIAFTNLKNGLILGPEKGGHEDVGEAGSHNAIPLTDMPPKIEGKAKMAQLSQNTDLRELRFLLPSGEAVLFVPPKMAGDDFSVLMTYLDAFKRATELAIKVAASLTTKDEQANEKS